MPVDLTTPSIEITLPGRPTDTAVEVGVSSWGRIYKSCNGAACYRVVATKNASLKMRSAARDMIALSRRPGIAPVLDAAQDEQAPEWFVLRYEIDADHFLSDSLRELSREQRLREFTTVFGWRNYWRGQFPESFLPTPSDIAFQAGHPFVLPFPASCEPDIDAIQEEPSRCLYLPPQYVQNRDVLEWMPTGDLHAFGAMLFQCLCELPAFDELEPLLLDVATGTAFDLDAIEAKLPYWMKRVSATSEILKLVDRLVSTDFRVRAAVDPEQANAALVSWLEDLNPLTAIRNLRKSGQPKDAYALFQDILLESVDYELLLVGADIAANDLGQYGDATDLLERAIAHSPEKSQAYLIQFLTLAKALDVPVFLEVCNRTSLGSKVAAMIDRDFKRVESPHEQALEPVMIKCLIQLKQFEACAHFIYPRLFADNEFCWGKFERRLQYTQALLGAGKVLKKNGDSQGASAWFGSAAEQLASIRSDLHRAHQLGSFPPEEIHTHGQTMSEIQEDFQLTTRNQP